MAAIIDSCAFCLFLALLSLYVQITSGAVSNSLDVKITAIDVCTFWSQDPRVVIAEWIIRTTYNVISKRLSKGLAIVCTRRGSCQSARDCFDVGNWLSVAFAWFSQQLFQWRCRRESIFNLPPFCSGIMCHTRWYLYGSCFSGCSAVFLLCFV